MPKDPELVAAIKAGGSVKIGDTLITKESDLPEIGEIPAPSAPVQPVPVAPVPALSSDADTEAKLADYEKLLNGLQDEGYDTDSVDDILSEIKKTGEFLDQAEAFLKSLGMELLGRETFTKDELLEAAKAKAKAAEVAVKPNTVEEKPDGKTEDRLVADLGEDGKVMRFADGATFVVKGDDKQAIGKVKNGVLQSVASVLKIDGSGNYRELLARILEAIEAQ